jgi:DNA-binding NtrC family response regulator
MTYHWPGNVRELRNVVERALILEKTNEIQPTSLPDFQLEARLHKSGAPKVMATGTLDEMMARYERELISSLLEQNHFNLAKTSDQLKISRHALRYRMQRLNIAEAEESLEEPASSATKFDSQ